MDQKELFVGSELGWVKDPDQDYRQAKSYRKAQDSPGH